MFNAPQLYVKYLSLSYFIVWVEESYCEIATVCCNRDLHNS